MLELSSTGGVVRTPTKDMVSQPLPSHPGHIPSLVPSPVSSINLPLFEDNTQIVYALKPPNISNYTTPNTMSPLLPTYRKKTTLNPIFRREPVIYLLEYFLQYHM